MTRMARQFTILCGIHLFFGVSVFCAEPEDLDSAIANIWQAAKLERRAYSNRGDLPKRIAVVKTKTAPTIDGVMEPGEWESATAITGLTEASCIGQEGVHGKLGRMGSGGERNEFQDKVVKLTGIKNIARHQSTFWISYDDDNLYVAHLSPPPPDIQKSPELVIQMLNNSCVQHDGGVNYDDMIDIEIMSPVYPDGDNYVIQANSIGKTFECIWGGAKGNMPGITLAWDPQVKNASTLDLNGWFIELSIPWKDFGPQVKNPAPGEIKHMNFARLWKKVMAEAHAWQAYDGRLPQGEVLFMGNEGITVRLKDTGNLPIGQAAFSADIKSSYPVKRDVMVEVTTDSGELHDMKELTLQPGDSMEYNYRGVVADFKTSTIALNIRDKETGDIVHTTTLPVIRNTKPTIHTRRYRGLDLIKFETDISFIGSAELSTICVALIVTDRKTGEKVFSNTYGGLTSYQPEFEISTTNWISGDYQAHFAFSAPGMEPYEAIVDYFHPELPDWWSNRYGLDDLDRDRVPYPWTDMTVNQDAINVWGRQYKFGRSLLPLQMTTLDQPILRAPIRITAKAADGEIIDTSKSDTKIEWTKVKQTRVEGRGMIEGHGFAIRNDFWAEYDGLLWNTITIMPRRKIEIVSMQLEIPLAKEFTDVINAMDYSTRTSGKLKEEGFLSEPTRSVWLGNGDGGIQWFCETDGWFFLKDPLKSLRIEVKNNEATMRVTMIDIPADFDVPHEIRFGLMATPVRPKTWRTPEHSRYRGVRGKMFASYYGTAKQFIPGIELPGSGLYVTLARTGPTEEYDLFGDEWRPDQRDRSFTTTAASSAYRNYFAWRHWRRQHESVSVDGKVICRGYAHLYYDVSALPRSTNKYIGQGYKRRDGSIAPTRNLLGQREMTRRLYNIALSNPEVPPRDHWIGYHSSCYEMMWESFSTECWTAEHLNGVINDQQPSYLGVVDPAKYRAIYMRHNFGQPSLFLGQGRITPAKAERAGGAEAVIDHLHGLELLHDGLSWGWHFQGANENVCRRTIDALNRHNVNHWTYQFTPYWRQDIVKLPTERMYASFYIATPSRLLGILKSEAYKTVPEFNKNKERDAKIAGYFGEYIPDRIRDYIVSEVIRSKDSLEKLKDKAIMIVYNDSAWEGEMRLKPDWKKLGIGEPETLKAENAVHSTGFRLEKTGEKDKDGNEIEKAMFFPRPEEFAKIENGELVFPMTKFNYRMIVLEKAE